MLRLKNANRSKMKHVIVPDHKPPLGYSCKICGLKASRGQVVIMDPSGLADKPCCVMHADCVKMLMQMIPEVIEGSDKSLAKYQKEQEEQERISLEFEELRETYASKII